MTTAKIVQYGRTQAVLLPREIRFDAPEVCILRLDDAVILCPAGKEWSLLETGLAMFTPDYMRSRRQPRSQQRRRFRKEAATG